MGLNLDASPEELKIFLEEVEEHFQTLEEDLIGLEKEEEFNEDLMQEIFRASHTLKGSSATLGHDRMAKLTHAMENVLDKLRKKQISVSSHLVDILFECLDCLRVLRDEIINDEESDLELEEILQKLLSFKVPEGGSGQEAVPQDPGSSCSQVILDAEISIEASWEDKDTVQKAVQQGLNPYLVQIKFDVEQEMLAVRTFVTVRAFEEFGEVVRTRPTEEEIESENVTDTLILLFMSSSLDEQAIRKLASELPNIASCLVKPYHDESIQADKNQVPPQVQDSTEVKAVEKSGNAAKSSGAGKKLNTRKANRTVRVDVDLLDSLMNLVGELVIDRTRLFQILGNIEVNYEMDEVSQDLGRTSVHIARVTTQLQEQIMKARMLPVENLFNKFPRMVRDLSQKADKEVNFVMTGQETELDRSIIEEIGDPLIHLLRNAVDHGLESPEEREAKGKSRTGELRLQTMARGLIRKVLDRAA